MPGDRIQKSFSQREVHIKTSSALNVSNTNSKPEELTIKDIEMLVDSQEQNLFKRAHVGKFLGLSHIDTSVESLDKCEMLTRNSIKAIPPWHEGLVWS